jgi:hypothetical protein
VRRSEIRDGLLAALDRVQEIPDVGLELIADLIVALVLHGFGAIADGTGFRLRLREAGDL